MSEAVRKPLVQRQSNDDSLLLDQVLKLVDAMDSTERGRLYTHLQFRMWDEEWQKVRSVSCASLVLRSGRAFGG